MIFIFQQRSNNANKLNIQVGNSLEKAFWMVQQSKKYLINVNLSTRLIEMLGQTDRNARINLPIQVECP